MAGTRDGARRRTETHLRKGCERPTHNAVAADAGRSDTPPGIIGRDAECARLAALVADAAAETGMHAS
jgi:hypothetical protein